MKDAAMMARVVMKRGFKMELPELAFGAGAAVEEAALEQKEVVPLIELHMDFQVGHWID